MINAIITDIEGTTSSIDFMLDVLFPYAQKHLNQFLKQHREDPVILSILNEVRTCIHEPDASLNRVEFVLQEWMEQDQKITPLKNLQGLIWQQGFEQGSLKAHLYSDADEYLNKWYLQNLSLYIYSSGSVFAQKMFFTNSDFGDLTSIFKGYFDTNIGAKREHHSYQKIAETINVTPEHILFLSDVKEELDAAKQIGMHTYWLIREGDLPQHAEHPIARTFADVEVCS